MSDKNTSPQALLKRAYSLKTEEDTKRLYRDWADTYDQTMVEGLGYLTPSKTSHLLSEHLVDKHRLILDVGCGTGLAGAQLAKLGFNNLHALDYSTEMLAVAEKLNVYSKFLQVDLNKPLNLADESYDAMICTGTFTHSHVGANCLDELLRLLKPSGLFACTVHNDLWKAAGFEAWVSKELENAKIKLISKSIDTYFESSKIPEGRFLVWQKI